MHGTQLLKVFSSVSIAAWAVVQVAPSVASASVPKQVVQIEAGSACPTGATFCYRPKKPTIASGTNVVWKNLTAASHTVTRCDLTNCPKSGGTGTDTGLGSPLIVPGTKYKFVFHGSGTYRYYCTVHGYAVMHGTITVA